MEFGLLQANILQNLTRNFVEWNLPEHPKEEEFFQCNVQETFGTNEMKKWLADKAPLDNYRKYLMPVWHKNNLVNEYIHHVEPNLKAIDLVLAYRTADIRLLDKEILISLIYPHTETALLSLFQEKKKRTTVFALTILCLSTLTLLLTDFLKEYYPVVSHFVEIYEQLKEDGIVTSNHPIKEFIRDSFIGVLEIGVFLVDNVYDGDKPKI